METRGRPKNVESVLKEEWEIIKVSMGGDIHIKFRRKDFRRGPYSIEIKPPKISEIPLNLDIQKNQTYGNLPVVMIFKTSKYANAQVKMKIWRNTNIDYILTAPSLPGVPDKGVILDVGVGDNFIEIFKEKHNIK